MYFYFDFLTWEILKDGAHNLRLEKGFVMYISPKELDMEKSKRRNLARNPPDHCLVTFERKGKVISIGGIMYPIQIDIDNVAREVFFS